MEPRPRSPGRRGSCRCCRQGPTAGIVPAPSGPNHYKPGKNKTWKGQPPKNPNLDQLANLVSLAPRAFYWHSCPTRSKAVPPDSETRLDSAKSRRGVGTARCSRRSPCNRDILPRYLSVEVGVRPGPEQDRVVTREHSQ